MRARTGRAVRLLILCGLIAELVLTPLVQIGPRAAVSAQSVGGNARSTRGASLTATAVATATATLSPSITALTTVAVPVTATASASRTPGVSIVPTVSTTTSTATATLTTTETATTVPPTAAPASATATTTTVPLVATSTPPTTSADSVLTGTAATLNSATDMTPTTDALTRLPLAFEPNQGQTDASVQFLSHGPGFSLYLTPDGATLAVARVRVPGRPGHGHGGGLKSLTRDDTLHGITGTVSISATALRLRYVGADLNAPVSGDAQLPGVANYLVGSDPSRWHTGVPTYATVSYHAVYPGIDLVYYGTAGRLEYDWRLAPGADPGQIALAVDGARDVRLDGDGNLALGTILGDIVQQAPRAYQTIDGVRHAVAVHYTLTPARQIGVALGAYDTQAPLVIDPVLSYSTYLGGSGSDAAYGVAVDAAGNAYVTGNTTSTDFPTAGALQGTNHGGVTASLDAFVSKLNAAGTALVYSTYLGGSGDDYGNAIAVDPSGNAYVTGNTSSSDFPTTANAYQPTGYSIFVSKLNAAGGSLLYSTYLGGPSGVGNNYGNGIAVDAASDAYVTGYAGSTDFPTTPGSVQPALNGFSYNAFVVKINTAASGSASLVYGTYLGGTSPSGDAGQGIAIDQAGDAYVTGSTTSTDFPTTVNAPQRTFGGVYDAFVSKLNPTGSTLLYSTYLGGSDDDEGEGIAVDAGGNAYVTGFTASTNFPTTAPAPPAHVRRRVRCLRDQDQPGGERLRLQHLPRWQ